MADLRAGEAEAIESQVMKIGSEQAVSVSAMFTVECRVLGAEATVVQEEARLRPEASEVEVLLSDPAKAREWLGWSATVSLDEGIARTARWLEQNIHLYDAERYHV